MDTTIQPGQGQSVQPDQGSAAPEGQGSQPQPEGITVLGKQYTSMEDMAKDFEGLGKKFSSRKQESEPEAQLEADEIGQIAELLAPELQKRGYLTADETKLQNLLAQNPELKEKEQELRDLANLPHNKGKAYEDIAAQYGLASSDKLSRAKSQGDVKGMPIPKVKEQPRSISDLSPQEYEEWRAQNLTGKSSFLRKV